MKGQALKRLASLGAVKVQARLVDAQVKAAALHGRFPTLRLGRFVVVAAAQAKRAKLFKGAWPIVLVQGQAFGTGLHESTRLMLGELQRLKPQGLRVLDIGAGSGILGFASLHLGAESVTCVEMESAACAELRENRSLNGVASRRLPVVCGKFPLARLKGKRWPLVLGNLVTPVLTALMPRLAAQVAAHGRLLCSGIHTRAERDAVTRAAQKSGLKLRRAAVLKQWNVLCFAKA